MGTAMHFAIDDIKNFAGINSDEEYAENENGEYRTMTKYVDR